MDRFNLSWSSYTEHLTGMFRDLYTENKFTDVTLVCDDLVQLRAHKTVLSACSPVFRSILASHHQIHPVIFLRGIQYLEMELILKFMYFGETTVFRERSEELQQVARDLEVKELSDLCDQQFTQIRLELQEEEESATENRIKIEEVVGHAGMQECVRCGVVYQEVYKESGTGQGTSHAPRIFSCTFCQETFQQPSRLSKHLYHRHDNLKMFCKKGACKPKQKK